MPLALTRSGCVTTVDGFAACGVALGALLGVLYGDAYA